MARRTKASRCVQAWIELASDDPEAVSALAIARAHLPAGRRLEGLRRVRLVELTGALPPRDEVESLLHRSTQFYNPHKERCTVRATEADPAPLHTGERAVLVSERGATRRAAAERWWLHETGEGVEVREGVAWAVRFGDGAPGEDLEDLVLVRGRRHGLLCNPHSQDYRLAESSIPVPWLGASEAAPPSGKGSRTRTRSHS